MKECLPVRLGGAFLIGCIVGLYEQHSIGWDMLLFIKTGLCSGFATSSTFSLETVKLLAKQKYV